MRVHQYLLALILLAAAAEPSAGASESKSTPFEAAPATLPGRIEAENFDLGGEGVAYHDTDALNNGNGKGNLRFDDPEASFRRDEGVDLSYTKGPRVKFIGDRTVFCQGKLTKTNFGREHHRAGFTMWMAGAGVKPGIVYGKTDDWSFRVAENPVTTHDLNATIMHLLGVPHEHLTYRFQGRDYRLTDLYGKVVEDILS